MLGPWQKTFLISFYIKVIEHHPKNVLVWICLPPGQRLLLTPRIGMGGTIWNHVKIISRQCQDHFKTILRHHMQTQYIFQSKINFHEMAHTNFFSSILITQYQPLVWTKNDKNNVFRFHTNQFSCCNIFEIYTLNYVHIYRKLHGIS